MTEQTAQDPQNAPESAQEGFGEPLDVTDAVEEVSGHLDEPLEAATGPEPLPSEFPSMPDNLLGSLRAIVGGTAPMVLDGVQAFTSQVERAMQAKALPGERATYFVIPMAQPGQQGSITLAFALTVMVPSPVLGQHPIGTSLIVTDLIPTDEEIEAMAGEILEFLRKTQSEALSTSLKG